MRGKTTPAVSPERAARWLREWAGIGGGITIDVFGNVCPWRLPGAAKMILVECDCTCGDVCPQGRTGIDFKCRIWKSAAGVTEEAQTRLLRELDEEDGLKAGVRVLASTAAMKLTSRALKTMTGEDDGKR